MARVSIVIPTYNYARFLGEAIQSVLDQTFNDFELIIVDDGSTDNTREMVSSFKDSRIKYLWQENRGVAAAQNTGIKASHGEFMTILGADDLYLPQSLELKVNLLDSRPNIDLVCSDAFDFSDTTGAIIGRLWHDPKRPHAWIDPERAARQPLKELLKQGCFIMPQTTMVRRRVFDAVGYFDESLKSGEDWDFFVRVVQRFSIGTINEPLTKIRHHDDSLCGSWDRWYETDVAIANKAIRSYSLSGDNLKLIKRRVARHHFLYGRNAVVNGQTTEGRRALVACIKVNMWRWTLRSLPYLFLSLLGTHGISAIKSCKKMAERHLVQSHLPGGA
jgi:glycosyltransferase involved in cell wall biosynthesis